MGMVFLIFVILTIQISPIDLDSQSTDQSIVQNDTVNKAQVDQETLKAYQEILEKTNSQLSLWWNPYGILIALLGVLFTIFTIFAAVVIFFQGRAAKKLLQDTLDNYSSILNEFVKEKNEELEEKKQKLQLEIDTLKEEVNESSLDENKYIQKQIERLQKEITALDKRKSSEPGPAKYYSNTIGFESRTRDITCPKCNVTFKFPGAVGLSNLKLVKGIGHLNCPSCGHVITIFPDATSI